MITKRGSMGIRHVRVKLPEDEYQPLKAKADGAGMKLHGYLREVIAKHVAGEEPPLYPKIRPEHDLLEYVLQNDKKAAESSKTSLRLFADAIAAKKKPARARRARGA